MDNQLNLFLVYTTPRDQRNFAPAVCVIWFKHIQKHQADKGVIVHEHILARPAL
jgi:hypothetical protein